MATKLLRRETIFEYPGEPGNLADPTYSSKESNVDISDGPNEMDLAYATFRSRKASSKCDFVLDGERISCFIVRIMTPASIENEKFKRHPGAGEFGVTFAIAFVWEELDRIHLFEGLYDPKRRQGVARRVMRADLKAVHPNY